jgi:uncharacterized protein YggL (DUF469 family)
MKKRLRKKLRLAEFRELGFEVRFLLPDDLDETDLEHFWDAFITDAIEREGLVCGGGCGRAWDIVVARHHRGSATEADRANIYQWLARYGAVRDVTIGPLVDMWHGLGERGGTTCASVQGRESNHG